MRSQGRLGAVAMLAWTTDAAEVATDGTGGNQSIMDSYAPGLTGGDMRTIGRTTQVECVLRLTGDARFCAVNFMPAPGSNFGMCVGVQHCTGAGSTTTGASTAPINTGGTTNIARPPPPPQAPDPSGLQGPPHDTRDNSCEYMRSYVAGAYEGTTELLDARLGMADCVTGQDYPSTRYCAVNFFLEGGAATSDQQVPHGRCKGVLPPCGAITPTAGAFSSVLPVDHTTDCTWGSFEQEWRPNAAPLPPPVDQEPPPPLPPPPPVDLSLKCPDGADAAPSYETCGDGVQHRAVFCRSDLDYTLGPASAAQVCAVMHQAACSCDCCVCSDGEPPSCATQALAPEPEVCGAAEISQLFQDINNICCAGQVTTQAIPAT